MSLQDAQDVRISEDSLVDFYEVLGLDRTASVEELQENLHDMRINWQGKAQRAGTLGDQARERILLISQATEAFADEDSRMRYNVRLRKSTESGPQDEAQVDWLSRAWGYYFIGEDGAGAVAARKAREKDPDNAMVYVVSAWIKLRQEDVKQAKQDADEAFVLDELGEDTADVHHVRGAVLFNAGNYQKAVESFDRALAKASTDEKPEIYTRKAWALDRDGKLDDALDACLAGFEQGVEMTSTVGSLLADVTAGVVVRKCDDPNKPDASIKAYQGVLQRFESGFADSAAKTTLVTYVKEQIARQEKLRTRLKTIKDLESKQRQLAGERNPGSDSPGFPLLAIGAAAFGFMLTPAASFFAVIGLAAAIWAGYQIKQGMDWKAQKAAYEGAQHQLVDVEKRLERLKKDESLFEVPPLKKN